MRFVLLALVVLAACEGGSGGPPPDPPQVCDGRCISDDPVVTSDDCCDSVTCWFDEDANEWQVTFCDPEPVMSCDRCGPTEQCVQLYDGTCGGGFIECVPKTEDCPQNACTEACEDAYCPSPYQCINRPPCGGEAQGSFTCYGH